MKLAELSIYRFFIFIILRCLTKHFWSQNAIVSVQVILLYNTTLSIILLYLCTVAANKSIAKMHEQWTDFDRNLKISISLGNFAVLDQFFPNVLTIFCIYITDISL